MPVAKEHETLFCAIVEANSVLMESTGRPRGLVSRYPEVSDILISLYVRFLGSRTSWPTLEEIEEEIEKASYQFKVLDPLGQDLGLRVAESCLDRALEVARLRLPRAHTYDD